MARGPRFHIADIPVRVDPSFFAVIGIFGLMAPGIGALLLWMVIATVSVLVHELGHAFAFRAYGSRASIRLHGMGGLTTGARLPPARNLVVSLAGPLAGLVLLGLPALALALQGVPEGSLVELGVTYAVFINVFWSLVNLLPVLPLDGGNVLHSLLDLATGRDAEVPARVVSIAIALGGGVAALAFGQPFILILAGLGLALNVTALGQARMRAAGGELRAALDDIEAGRTDAALRRAEPLVEARTPAVRMAAVEIQAWALLQAGAPASARAVLARRPPDQPVPTSLEGAFALLDGRTDQGLALLTYGLVREDDELARGPAALVADQAGAVDALAAELLAVESDAGLAACEVLAATLHRAGRFPAAATVAARLAVDPRAARDVWAYNCACSIARAGHPEAALGWLDAAVRSGWRDQRRLAEDPDLASVRALPSFALGRP